MYDGYGQFYMELLRRENEVHRPAPMFSVPASVRIKERILNIMGDSFMQRLVDSLSESARMERMKYHLTLGKLIKELEETKVDGNPPVVFDFGGSPGMPHSYRGYYSDLSFEPVEQPIPALAFLAMLRSCLGKTYEGYKGGDFKMEEGTPLWAAPYSMCGRAIMGLAQVEGKIIILTKEID